MEGKCILVLNAGSTSLKFGLVWPGRSEALVSGEVDWAGRDRRQALLTFRPAAAEPDRFIVAVDDDHDATEVALQALRDWHAARAGQPLSIAAVGHRVVHGGAEFRQSMRLDEQVKSAIQRLGELAPLHNPPALESIRTAERLLPGVPQVAVFDTTFFASLPPRASVYPLPYAWYEQWGVRRFGFHGISHAYCAGRAAEFLRRDSEALRLISCHLGGGCSATAVRNGAAVATTLGFSPLEGLMMGTRPGSIDPGILVYLQRRRGLSVDEIDHALNHGSGLLGVSGLGADHASVERAAAQGHERARLAFDMYADRVRSAIGALTATLGGVDVLVFAGGTGVGSAAVRAAACQGLACMGIVLDPERNATCAPDADIAAEGSGARILVVRTREDLLIARETCRVTGL